MRDVPGACVERLPALFGASHDNLIIILSGPEGPEPALGSLGATCSVVIREIHSHADAAFASRPSYPRTAACGFQVAA